jgi:hypothetical protein
VWIDINVLKNNLPFVKGLKNRVKVNPPDSTNTIYIDDCLTYSLKLIMDSLKNGSRASPFKKLDKLKVN